MDKKEFGRLVATLRQDLNWTQFQLAEVADVDEAVVSQIERGVKKYFDPELLLALANALQMTTLERREFFLAASGLTTAQRVRQPSDLLHTPAFDAPGMVDKLCRLLGEFRAPAFLIDAYADVVAANHSIVRIMDIPPAMLASAASVPGGYNMMRVTFSKDAPARPRIEKGWDYFALSGMRTFRETSLRYRATAYFQYLIDAFRNTKEYPAFTRYWNRVSSAEDDKEISMDYFNYVHQEFGPLHHIASPLTTITPYGELILIYYAPLNQRTREVFEALTEEGQSVYRLAPWPEKRIV